MSCLIQLNSDQAEYYPGSAIAGRVTCTLHKSINIRGVKIKLKGKEHNKWTRRAGNRNTHYSGKNKFLRVEYTLQEEGDLGPGIFEYPFIFQLPPDIPDTYNGLYGGIHFTMAAKVDIPFRIDYKDKMELTVFAPINLNDEIYRPRWEPASYSKTKTLCCLCCTSDPITMDVYLERQVFVPGDTARVKVNISNLSNARIEAVKVKMGTMIESFVTSPAKRSKKNFELLTAQQDSGVAAHGEWTYNFALVIPENNAMVHNFNNCELFKQVTTIQVKAVLANHLNLKVAAEVAMGHIPVTSPANPYQNNIFSQENRASATFCPPPQYSEGITLKFKGKEHNRWSRRSGNRTTYYTGKNKFLRVEHNLCGPGNLDPGTLEYPFTFKLPVNIPGTFKGLYGGINYTISAKVDIPFKFNYKDTKQIMVFSPVNLNDGRFRNQRRPASYTKSKTLCCLCCTSGPVAMDVYLEKQMFIPGDTVRVRVNISNMSSAKVKSVKVKMGTVIVSYVTSPRKRNRQTFNLLAAQEEEGVPAHGEGTSYFSFIIPRNAVVPNFSNSVLFSDVPQIKVTAVFANHMNMSIIAGVALGNIPLDGPQVHSQNSYFQGNTDSSAYSLPPHYS